MLVLDRSLTPAGERRLKDLRCLGRGSDFRWPSPGVFSVAGLAEKILIGVAQSGAGTGPRELIANEELLIGLWAKRGRRPALKSLRRELSEALKLAPLGLAASEWAEVLGELQNDTASGELRLWSERILLYLEAWAFASEREQSLTMWDHVLRVLLEVDAEALRKIPWLSLLERHPFMTKDLRFTVPELQDPQPLEAALLAKLPLPVLRLRSELSDEFPFANLPPLAIENRFESADDLAFAWAFDASPPGPVETLTAMPGHFPIDVATKTWEDDNEELRVLGLFCESLADPENPQHRFHRHVSRAGFLKEWQLDTGATPKKIVETWRREREPRLSASLLDTMTSFSLSELGESFAYLAESPLFRIERLPYSDPRLDPRGAPLVTLVDLPFMGARNFALWGHAKDFEKHFSPTSISVLRNQDFPSSLRKMLEARGHWMPDPEREQRALLGALESLGDSLHVVSSHTISHATPQSAPSWKIPALAAREIYSPSALEAYAECSMRFYVERVLRPGRISDWDPVPMDPLSAGLWVHAVLEDFLKTPDWQTPMPKLQAILQTRRTEIFSAPHSSAYARILDQESALIAERLMEHIENFEKPLLSIMGERTRLEAETPLSSRFRGHRYNGKLDRLDYYGTTTALLWDYKTGSIKQSDSLKQIANHKFQWHLYRALLHELRPELLIAGGGYLNPLNPSKSRLLAFAPLFPSAALEEFTSLCKSVGHPLEIIEDEATLGDALGDAVEILRGRLTEGIVAPDGDARKVCIRCTLIGICGKPYFESELGDELT